MENETKRSRIVNMTDFVNGETTENPAKPSSVSPANVNTSSPASSTRQGMNDAPQQRSSRVAQSMRAENTERVQNDDFYQLDSGEDDMSMTRNYTDILQKKRQEMASAPKTASRQGTRNATASNSPNRRKKKKSKKNKIFVKPFKIGIILYSLVLVIAVVVACIILHAYHNSCALADPTLIVNEVKDNFASVSKLKEYLADNADVVKSSKSIIGFDEKYYDLIDGKEISYIKVNTAVSETTDSAAETTADASGETTTASETTTEKTTEEETKKISSADELLVYNIKADNAIVAQVTVKQSDEKGAFGVERYELVSIDTTVAFDDVKAYSVLVPEGSTVVVNGVTLDDDCITGTGVPAVLESVTQFLTDVPEFTTYTVKTLTDDLEVSGTDADGKDLVFSETENSYVAGGKADDDFIDEVKGVVEAGLKEYALYFIYNAFNLNLYIKEGSELHDMIFGSDEYDPINPALYTYEWIDSYEFDEFEAKNYTVYSDECFTVDVKYHLTITPVAEHPEFQDDNQQIDATWVWVPDGTGSWSIAASIVH